MTQIVRPAEEALGGPRVAPDGRDALRDRRVLEALQLLGDGAFQVLSIDVFDTLLWRIVPDPVDAFLLVGERLGDQGLLARHCSPEVFAELRRGAEVRARARLGDSHVAPEVTLAAIYREVAPDTVPDLGPDELAEFELDVEKTITFPDADVALLARIARTELVKNVVLVSDTYFSRAELAALVNRHLSIAFDPRAIFTSSDHGIGKATGLFGQVLETLDVKGDDVLHLGDNYDADVRGANRYGIRAIHFEKLRPALEAASRREGLVRGTADWPFESPIDRYRGDFGLTALRSKSAASVDGAHFSASASPFWEFGASVIGPAFAGFAAWVHRRAREEGVTSVYCLMREGDFLSRLVNGARQALGSDVRAHTLWLSRHVCSRAAVVDASPEELRGFLDRRIPPTFDQLCTSLGITTGDVPDLDLAPDAPLSDPHVAARVIDAMSATPSARAAIVAASAALRSRLVAHVRRRVGASRGPVVLVDLGWGATIQAKLDTALRHDGIPLRTLGLYLLTSERLVSPLLDGTRAEGFLAHGGHPAHVSTSITRSPEILEQLCMCDQGTLVDFDDAGEPVLDGVPVPAAQVLERTAAQRGILAFQDQWTRWRTALPTDGVVDEGARPLLATAVERFVAEPTEAEAGMFGAWVHDQNYGSHASESVVARQSREFLPYMTPVQLLRTPMTSLYWPFGLAAGHNLAVGTGAVRRGSVPAQAFEAWEPCEVTVFVPDGHGLAEVARKAAGPNVNGLSYFSAEIRRRGMTRIRLRFSDRPGVLRVDRVTVAATLEGRADPVRLDITRDRTSGLRRGDGAVLAPGVIASGSACQLEVRLPAEWGSTAYAAELQVAFAWMHTPGVRGRFGAKTARRGLTGARRARRVLGTAKELAAKKLDARDAGRS